jgi:hypothetical protein
MHQTAREEGRTIRQTKGNRKDRQTDRQTDGNTNVPCGILHRKLFDGLEKVFLGLKSGFGKKDGRKYGPKGTRYLVDGRKERAGLEKVFLGLKSAFGFNADGRKHGPKNRQNDGWMDGWMERRTH